MFAAPAMLAAVVQITNGLLFAEMPFEFNRPVYPEASGLMAQSHAHGTGSEKIWSVGAVDHTFDDLGAGYIGRLRVDGRAFSDRKFRHENLLWLAEVGGERYACYDTATGPYNPVDWIDVPMAMSNTNLFYDTRRRDAISAYMQTTNALQLMTEITAWTSEWAEGEADGMAECVGMMRTVQSLAAVYQEQSGILAEETNAAARTVAEAAIDDTPLKVGVVHNSIVQALALTNIVSSYASEFGNPGVVSNLNEFIAYGDVAIHYLTNSAHYAASATNYSHQATPYLVTTTNEEDRAVAISLALSAEDCFADACSNYLVCASNLLVMESKAMSVMTNIHYSALGMNGKYVRTPAYFCNHDSAVELLRVMNSYTNLYTSIRNGVLLTEYSQDEIAEYGSFEEFLYETTGFGQLSGKSAPVPTKGSPFSANPFVKAMEMMTNEYDNADATLYIPIERVCNINHGSSTLYRIETSETRDSCDDIFHVSVKDDTGYTPEGAYQLCSWRTGNPDPAHETETLYVWTTTNDVENAVVTNVFLPISTGTPVTYRDSSYHYWAKETRWALWAVTEWKAPFCALVYSDPQQSNLPFTIINTNLTEEVSMIDTLDGLQNSFKFECFAPSVLTASRPLTVKKMCEYGVMMFDEETFDPYLAVFFRTNTYHVSTTRATGVQDDSIGINKEGEDIRFVSLVADTLFDYNIAYAGWKDWTASSSHPYTTISGYGKRMLVPISVPTKYPNSDTDRFEFAMTNVMTSLRSALESNLFARIGADFDDVSLADEKPPFLPSQYSGMPFVTSYPADRTVSITFSITNLYVAARLHFSQGVTNTPKYVIPGYKHLDGLPPPLGGDGWIGPFDTREGHGWDEVLELYTGLYQDLINSQTNSVPSSVQRGLYDYELEMVEDSLPMNVSIPPD